MILVLPDQVPGARVTKAPHQEGWMPPHHLGGARSHAIRIGNLRLCHRAQLSPKFLLLVTRKERIQLSLHGLTLGEGFPDDGARRRTNVGGRKPRRGFRGTIFALQGLRFGKKEPGRTTKAQEQNQDQQDSHQIPHAEESFKSVRGP